MTCRGFKSAFDGSVTIGVFSGIIMGMPAPAVG